MIEIEKLHRGVHTWVASHTSAAKQAEKRQYGYSQHSRTRPNVEKFFPTDKDRDFGVKCLTCGTVCLMGNGKLADDPIYALYELLSSPPFCIVQMESVQVTARLKEYYALYLQEQIAKNKRHDDELEALVYKDLAPRLTHVEHILEFKDGSGDDADT